MQCSELKAGRHVVGHINNKGIIKFVPECAKLMKLLYEIGYIGTPGPTPGKTIKNLPLPAMSKVTIVGETNSRGFLTFPNSRDNDLFYYADADNGLSTNYPCLITRISWQSNTDVELKFMYKPEVDGYYTPGRVYPALDLNHQFMFVFGNKGEVFTQDYKQLFVHADRECKVTLELYAENPFSYKIPPVKETPTPTYLKICDEKVIVAYRTLSEEMEVDYQPSSDFVKVAELIKSTVELLSIAKPDNEIIFPSETVLDNSINDNVIILQNVKMVKSLVISSQYYGGIKSVTNQYNDRITSFTSFDFTINIPKSLYKDDEYPVVDFAICIHETHILPPVQYPYEVKMGLTNDWSPYNFSNNKEGRKLYIVVNPKSSVRSRYLTYSARFHKDEKTFLPFSVYLETTNILIPAYGLFKVKITFAKRQKEEMPSTVNSWDPFFQKIYNSPNGGTFNAPYDMTVAKALLVGGGGGGGGGAKIAYVIDETKEVETIISGDGGGRGEYKIINSFEASRFKPETKTYVSTPVTYKVGLGGKGGRDTSFADLCGNQGEPTTLTYNNITEAALGGSGGSRFPNIGEGGSGAGSSLTNGLFTSTNPGLAGQGGPGTESISGKGGKGGNGPDFYFDTINDRSYPGNNGTTGIVPAGGGAACIQLDNERLGKLVGFGGNGGDASKVDGASGEDGSPGYACILSRYIAY